MRVFCHYCGQGFKRDEHLERHILTHTNLRPFQCRECKLAFKRKDLLSRHYRSIHAGTANSNGEGETSDFASIRPSMGRIPIACISCAESKTKCDDRTPCSRCTHKGIKCERRAIRRKSLKASLAHKSTTTRKQEQEAPNTTPKTPKDETSQGPSVGGSAATSHMLVTLGPSEKFQPVRDSEPTIYGNIFRFDSPVHSPIPSSLLLDKSTMRQGPGFENVIHGQNTFSSTNLDMLLFQSCSDVPSLSTDLDIYPDDTFLISPVTDNTSDQYATRLETCDDWPFYRCNPASFSGENMDPRFSVYDTLIPLRHLLKPEFWTLHVLPLQTQLLAHQHAAGSIAKEICAAMRDWLLSVTQHLWRVVKQEASPYIVDKWSECPDRWMENVILIPPQEILQRMIRNYIDFHQNRFELYPTGNLKLYSVGENSLIKGMNILIILARATRAAATQEGRSLSNGFLGLCHTFLRNADWTYSAEELELSLALVQLSQWSGDASHMNAVHETWEKQTQSMKSIFSSSPNSTYAEHDSQSSNFFHTNQATLLYSWIALDLELSVFQDRSPKLSVQDYASAQRYPLPGTERHESTSLNTLFQAFLEGHLSSNKECVTPTNLRLLLHPLQGVSAQLHQCLNRFGNVRSPDKEPRTTLSLASKAFIDEIDSLLQRWQRLAQDMTQMSGPCPSITETLIIYHLICINNYASFPDAERLIREQKMRDLARTSSARSWVRFPGPKTVSLLFYHCGQLFRHSKTLPLGSRPLWWATALYRTVLVLSLSILTNMAQAESGIQLQAEPSHVPSLFIALDGEYGTRNPDQELILQQFIGFSQGIPHLTRLDGSMLLLSSPTEVLDHFIEALNDHLLFEPTVLANGICTILKTLRSRWSRES